MLFWNHSESPFWAWPSSLSGEEGLLCLRFYGLRFKDKISRADGGYSVINKYEINTQDPEVNIMPTMPTQCSFW